MNDIKQTSIIIFTLTITFLLVGIIYLIVFCCVYPAQDCVLIKPASFFVEQIPLYNGVIEQSSDGKTLIYETNDNKLLRIDWNDFQTTPILVCNEVATSNVNHIFSVTPDVSSVVCINEVYKKAYWCLFDNELKTYSQKEMVINSTNEYDVRCISISSDGKKTAVGCVDLTNNTVFVDFFKLDEENNPTYDNTYLVNNTISSTYHCDSVVLNSDGSQSFVIYSFDQTVKIDRLVLYTDLNNKWFNTNYYTFEMNDYFPGQKTRLTYCDILGSDLLYTTNLSNQNYQSTIRIYTIPKNINDKITLFQELNDIQYAIYGQDFALSNLGCSTGIYVTLYKGNNQPNSKFYYYNLQKKSQKFELTTTLQTNNPQTSTTNISTAQNNYLTCLTYIDDQSNAVLDVYSNVIF